jgi:hypothetical protein
MHAEAVRVGALPSSTGLIEDTDELNCAECEASYRLHYDKDTEGSLAYLSILAEEIILARHPHHSETIALDGLEVF